MAVSANKIHLSGLARKLVMDGLIGAIDTMLGKVADWYEQEVDDAVDALTSLLEPMIMAFLGVVIGGIVIGMYLPIFKMGAVV